jgi:hypothetical protein
MMDHLITDMLENRIFFNVGDIPKARETDYDTGACLRTPKSQFSHEPKSTFLI